MFAYLRLAAAAELPVPTAPMSAPAGSADASAGAAWAAWAAWAAVGMLLLIAMVFAVGTLTLSAWVGRARRGPIKDTPFESGIVPTGSARRRFHIRYYLIALLFLLFDVEVVLLFPWAVLFGPGAQSPSAGMWLAEMFVFVAILLVGYVYAWRKGSLRFD